MTTPDVDLSENNNSTTPLIFTMKSLLVDSIAVFAEAADTSNNSNGTMNNTARHSFIISGNFFYY